MSNYRYDLALGQPPPHNAKAKLLYVSNAKYGGDWQSVPHTHSCTEFFYVVGGKGQFQIQDQFFTVSDGDLVVVNPNLEHTETSFAANPLEYIVMGVEGLELVMDAKGRQHYCIVSFRGAVVDIQHYLHAMLREVETKAPGYDAVCQNLMDILLIQLMRRVQLGATVASPQGSPSRKAAAARRFIDANYRDNITLDQMAEALHMSKYHLAHIFRLEYGMSPIHYMHSLRLQESRKLLSTTDYSLTQIARMTGFSSPSYFSQRFRAVEGINPGQYRARFRASQGGKSQTKEE